MKANLKMMKFMDMAQFIYQMEINTKEYSKMVKIMDMAYFILFWDLNLKNILKMINLKNAFILYIQ